MEKDTLLTPQVLTILYVTGMLYPHFLPYLYHLLPLCRGEPLGLVQVDLGLVEPGAYVSQVLVENFHFILVTLHSYKGKTKTQCF